MTNLLKRVEESGKDEDYAIVLYAVIIGTRVTAIYRALLFVFYYRASVGVCLINPNLGKLTVIFKLRK